MDNIKYDDEQEKKDIEMFLAKVDEWNKKIINSRDSISASSILDYVESLLEACCSTTTTNSNESSSSQHNLPSIPDQMLHLTGRIASEIACNAMNDVDSHNITLSVFNIFEEFSWDAKVALSIASYILTYGNNGLNLSLESKMVFSRALINMSRGIVFSEERLSPLIKLEDPQFSSALTSLRSIYYSIIRVVVVVASSHLLTRSSRDDKFGTTTLLTWCSRKLEVIVDRFNSATDELDKLIDNMVNENEMKIKVPLQLVSPENIGLNIVGDKLEMKVTNYDKSTKEAVIVIDKNEYEKEGITAEWNKGWLCITIPKRKKVPERIHIPIRIIS